MKKTVYLYVERDGLNPYYTGILYTREQAINDYKPNEDICLNHYYTGILYTRIRKTSRKRKQPNVLILIILEYYIREAINAIVTSIIK